METRGLNQDGKEVLILRRKVLVPPRGGIGVSHLTRYLTQL